MNFSRACVPTKAKLKLGTAPSRSVSKEAPFKKVEFKGKTAENNIAEYLHS